MAADDDVLNLEMLDGVENYALGVNVGGRDDIGDVSVNKDITGLEAEDGGLRDTRIGAAYPEDLGFLARSEGGEELGFVGCGFLRPLMVLVKSEGEAVF